MIRPVSMAGINFKADRSNLRSQGRNYLTYKSQESSNNKSGGSSDWKYLVGIILGISMGIGGANRYNEMTTEDMLNDMKEELDASHDKDLLIEDITGDNYPEIMFVNMDDDTTYYDFKNHDIGTKPSKTDNNLQQLAE